MRRDLSHLSVARRISWWAGLLSLVLLLPFGKAAAAADDDIRYLIDYVAESGVRFVRNGDEHTAIEAADHLAMKYRRASRHAKTAEAFIDNLASKSSWTGKPYTVILPDGQQREAGPWLYNALHEYRQRNNGEP